MSVCLCMGIWVTWYGIPFSTPVTCDVDTSGFVLSLTSLEILVQELLLFEGNNCFLLQD